MRKILCTASFLLLLLSSAAVYLLRTVPSGQLWKGYSVLYVSSETDDRAVEDALSGAGMTGYVSLAGQYMPLALPSVSPEVTMQLVAGDDSPDGYLHRRRLYFFDLSRTHKLFYIESSEKGKLPAAVHRLEREGIRCGVDAQAAYPWLLVLVLAVMLSVLAFFSRNRLLFVLASLPPVFYALCNPFYTLAVAAGLLLLCVFFLTNVWRRRGAAPYVLGKRGVPLMLAVSAVSAFSCSLKAGLLYMLVLAECGAVLFLYECAQDFLCARSLFSPVPILPARRLSLFAGRARPVLLVLCGCFAAVLLLSAVAGTDAASSGSGKVMLPSAAAPVKGDEPLPDLDDFCRWSWEVMTFPYRSLNAPSEVGTSVSFPRYSYEDGRITRTDEVLSYDDGFKEARLSEVESFRFNSVEQVLLAQGGRLSPGYSSSQSYHNSFFSQIMLLICFFVLLFISISVMMRKRF